MADEAYTEQAGSVTVAILILLFLVFFFFQPKVFGGLCLPSIAVCSACMTGVTMWGSTHQKKCSN